MAFRGCAIVEPVSLVTLNRCIPSNVLILLLSDMRQLPCCVAGLCVGRRQANHSCPSGPRLAEARERLLSSKACLLAREFYPPRISLTGGTVSQPLFPARQRLARTKSLIAQPLQHGHKRLIALR